MSVNRTEGHFFNVCVLSVCLVCRQSFFSSTNLYYHERDKSDKRLTDMCETQNIQGTLQKYGFSTSDLASVTGPVCSLGS